MAEVKQPTSERFPLDTQEKHYKMFVDGHWIEGSDGETFRCVDPFEDVEWGYVPIATEQDVDRAVLAARAAFEGEWGASRPVQRAALLHRLADLIEENADDLGLIQTHENGKLIEEMTKGTLFLANHARFCAGLAEQLHGYSVTASVPNTTVYTVKEPIGVVAAITPWNSPLGLLAWKLFPALAAGCTLVIKPSEVTPTSTLRFAELCEQAGFPAGVVNVVTGFGRPTGAALVNHPGVDKIAFTGSTETGKIMAHAAADRLAGVSLELGGKSPNIIFADADLENAVHGVMAGIFAATGQTCMAGSRVFVESSIHDKFVDMLSERARALRLGDPLDPNSQVGPLAFRPQLDKVLKSIEIGLSEGATLVTGGKRPNSSPELQRGMFVEPTVFTDVKNESRLAQQEIFGPVAAVIRFEDEDDVVRMANDIPFGLAGAVWTQDISRAHRMIRKIRAGTVWVNTYRALSYTAPFGGYKESGVGRELGIDALDDFTESKTVWIDHGNTQVFGRNQ